MLEAAFVSTRRPRQRPRFVE